MAALHATRDASVLLITLDTTRADHLECYRQTRAPAVARTSHQHDLSSASPGSRTPSPEGVARTPHLDALAARGVRFDHATAQVPLTLPSHACIMTGAYPPVHGLRDMGGFVLGKTHPTIASIARTAGFATAAFVGSKVLNRRMGLANGFATYDDDMRARDEGDMLPGIYPERRAAVVTDRALDWLKQNSQSRFFLWAHYYDPHAPYDPPEPYKTAYAKDLYSGEIAYTDDQVGRLLDWVAAQPLASRTLIVVIGDHGESLGEHGEKTHGVFLYESTMHVPFIIAGPEVPAGKVINDQVRSIDIMPTVLDFLNLSPGSEAQGVSLWPLVQQGRKVRSNYAYLETLYPRTYMNWSELRAMRTDAWKLIVAPRPELYNLERDPQESNNLIARYPADADQLQKKIWEVAGEQNRQEKVVANPVDPATRQELESLGYVSAGTPREIRLGTQAPDPKDRVGVLESLSEVEFLLNKHSYPRAAEMMQHALERDPTNALVHIYLATALEKTGQLERAVATYQHAVDLKLGTDQIYSRLGKVYLRLHQLDKAVDAMTRGMELNPTDLDNLRNLATAELELGRVSEAEKAFKAITTQNDRYAAAWNGLGLVAIRRDDAEEARRDFEKAIAADSNEPEALLNLGVLYQKAGNKQQAVLYLQKFLDTAPADNYSHMFPQVREAIRECRQP
jgi:arylsulfatase A-like enzyme/Flp pilus assembly protein TadD